ncbi:bifunctional hydroxymethylpyrimidine kinase/phosphomethylpyrimidine kinase [Lachnospiraceae bacterium MD1]|uniref:Hydroxymethylpyrimidine/phosphomethylpyrimidine kinase n=1 Tax=Variimorphobacter saccharofermentans TaxID=2755051 RepID=A0A839K4L0_9FIRM|nr:bifunctional hydroxymethylpyrimidine kinase/phosphomethylpyrimidine kinase [Variimorphobacter saccharofermentans]MBB2183611.1 bifunctional hydroxymethylpyrimidine kinase/phosphomethylpyrimidine kinase [Variimorphobacter saccharofermentans]
MKKVLTIAGSDCSGGAGIQADIKTITVHNMYAMSVITALTAQNTTGVSGVMEVTPEFIEKQMDMVCSDIYPDAVKIGMLANKDIIDIVEDKLKQYELKNIVLDPVMISTSGSKLLQDNAIDALITKLIPLATVITPNIPEAECLCGFPIRTKEEMQKAAEVIARHYSGSILIKGGHLEECSDDLLYEEGACHWYQQYKVSNPNTHGTGCTLSTAIACNLAAGRCIRDGVAAAKSYITGALEANLNLGKGSGPLNHCYRLA